MKQAREHARTSQAFLNEYKGNLFEFLCAQSMSRELGLELDFLSGVSPELLANLTKYESKLRFFDPKLPEKLKALGEATAKEMKISLGQDFSVKNIQGINLVGKLIASEKKNFHEGDILIQTEKGQLPLSIKLCKDKSYVNSKSAGIKSIFKEYFSFFPGVNDHQNSFNENIDKEFNHLIHDLYEMEGLGFKGCFDHQWTDAGKSELPGEQSKESSERIQRYYHNCAKYLLEYFLGIYEFSKSRNEEGIYRALLSLMGLTSDNLIQVKCFHKDHEFCKVKMESFQVLFESLKNKERTISILFSDTVKSSFDISFGDFCLQLRVKPMNKFTTPGLKVNCSVKIIDNN